MELQNTIRSDQTIERLAFESELRRAFGSGNLYRVLGVGRRASRDSILIAHLQRIRQASSSDSHRRRLLLDRCRDVLVSPRRRFVYEELGEPVARDVDWWHRAALRHRHRQALDAHRPALMRHFERVYRNHFRIGGAAPISDWRAPCNAFDVLDDCEAIDVQVECAGSRRWFNDDDGALLAEDVAPKSCRCCSFRKCG